MQCLSCLCATPAAGRFDWQVIGWRSSLRVQASGFLGFRVLGLLGASRFRVEGCGSKIEENQLKIRIQRLGILLLLVVVQNLDEFTSIGFLHS